MASPHLNPYKGRDQSPRFHHQPRTFLDLPVELRLWVYEHYLADLPAISLRKDGLPGLFYARFNICTALYTICMFVMSVDFRRGISLRFGTQSKPPKEPQPRIGRALWPRHPRFFRGIGWRLESYRELADDAAYAMRLFHGMNHMRLRVEVPMGGHGSLAGIVKVLEPLLQGIRLTPMAQVQILGLRISGPRSDPLGVPRRLVALAENARDQNLSHVDFLWWICEQLQETGVGSLDVHDLIA